MKLEFSAVVKGVPAAEVKCNLECTAEELSVMLSDPVYQELGKKLINEVSFKPVQQKQAEDTVSELCNRVNGLVSSLKKEREAYEKLRQTEREVVSELNRQITKLAERNSKF